jgi:hypothetical protein
MKAARTFYAPQRRSRPSRRAPVSDADRATGPWKPSVDS